MGYLTLHGQVKIWVKISRDCAIQTASLPSVGSTCGGASSVSGCSVTAPRLPPCFPSFRLPCGGGSTSRSPFCGCVSTSCPASPCGGVSCLRAASPHASGSNHASSSATVAFSAPPESLTLAVPLAREGVVSMTCSAPLVCARRRLRVFCEQVGRLRMLKAEVGGAPSGCGAPPNMASRARGRQCAPVSYQESRTGLRARCVWTQALKSMVTMPWLGIFPSSARTNVAAFLHR